MSTPARNNRKGFFDSLEETVIAVVLGLMTMITFANVIARYVFNSNILWALETTVFLFAWLVLIGASYCVKHNHHLGVDIVANMLSPKVQKRLTLAAVAACLTFSLLVLWGAFEYWIPFATDRAWYEVDDIPMPEMLQVFAGALNEGERWEKLPRFIPYTCLPLGFLLLTLRFVQAGIRVWNDEQSLVIASHELDHSSDDVSNVNAEVR